MNNKQKSTDGFLILQYREGSMTALSQLVERYHKDFCKRAYWIIKDPDLAKDVAQESWMIIINKLKDLEKVDSFKSWAFRIVYTKAIDRIKLLHKERNSIDSIGSLDTNNHESEDKKSVVQQRLLDAIHKLPKEKQDIIRLFYKEGYSINEISTFLDIPKGTVKSRLFKAREKLKSIIKNKS
jgi:RNA polymerase sigma-70 factor (ECF subfamily)